MGVLPTFTYVYHMQAWYPRRSEEAIESSGTGVVATKPKSSARTATAC